MFSLPSSVTGHQNLASKGQTGSHFPLSEKVWPMIFISSAFWPLCSLPPVQTEPKSGIASHGKILWRHRASTAAPTLLPSLWGMRRAVTGAFQQLASSRWAGVGVGRDWQLAQFQVALNSTRGLVWGTGRPESKAIFALHLLCFTV